MIILRRALPLVTALVIGVAFFEQFHHPLSYPWIVILAVAALPVAAVGIAWGKIRMLDLIEKMLPAFLLIVSLAFALLFTETALALDLMIGIATAASYISLELLFTLAFDPARYPVSGLSRVGIAYVPAIMWYAASTSVGLLVFLHSDRLWHVLLLVVLGIILFRTTGHPGASWKENAVWGIVGGLVGAHVGFLGLLLPVSMPVHGMVAAILISAPLRARRYKYGPSLSSRQAWIEGGLAMIALIAVLATSMWI